MTIVCITVRVATASLYGRQASAPIELMLLFRLRSTGCVRAVPRRRGPYCRSQYPDGSTLGATRQEVWSVSSRRAPGPAKSVVSLGRRGSRDNRRRRRRRRRPSQDELTFPQAAEDLDVRRADDADRDVDGAPDAAVEILNVAALPRRAHRALRHQQGVWLLLLHHRDL